MKKMRLLLLVLLTTLGFSGTSFAAEPPETLSDAMLNFGRAFLPADRLAQKADGDAESITDQDVQDAVDGIDRVLLNVETVLNAKGADAFIPSKAHDMREPERTAYLARFNELMGQFRSLVREYRALVIAHDYPHLGQKRAKVLDAAKTAHSSL
jgi:hypothetical protein